MRNTGGSAGVERELKGIRYQSKTYARLETLMNRVNAETIKEQHRKQEGKKATGIDGVSKDEYGKELNERAEEPVSRMKRFSYKPQPVRRTYIPKGNGRMRPLGIPAYEDRPVQGAMADILNDICEERFLDCSYGFRPKRSAHDVVKHINQTVMTKKTNWVLEADIKGFFDNVNHDWLMKFLEHDIADKNFLRYVKRFLIASVMEGTEYGESDKGTPQGGLISPVLANVYLHYVLDLWIEKKVKKELKGEAYYVRYADDFLLMFQYESEAKRVMAALNERPKKFGLEPAEDKTRILPFGRFKGTKEDFDFLGFTFFNTKTREGKYRVGVRTSKKKLKMKKQTVKAWLKTRMTKPVSETMEQINRALSGHNNYYGTRGNFRKIQQFWKYVKYESYRMLNRRHQKKSLKYDKFLRIWNYYVKEPHLTTDIWNWKPMLV
jgi:group II intron reverse transcriptase/maturase